VAPRPKPGFAWYIVCDAGFAVGLVSHYLPKWGHLVWMAEPVFDDEPTVEDVLAIRRWRWPVLFPLGAAVHRHIATRIGVVPIPARLLPATFDEHGGDTDLGDLAAGRD